MTGAAVAARELAGVIGPERLAVCRTCGQLRGSEGPYRQAYACTPSDPERPDVRLRARRPGRPGGDRSLRLHGRG